MTDELHERAVEAASAQMRDECAGWFADRPESALFDWRVAGRNAIDAYLASLAEQGDPLVRVSEVVEWLRERPCGRWENLLIDAFQRRFAPGPEDGER